MIQSPRVCRQRTDTGFTLLEMLVVLGIVGMLMGLGVGLLRRSGTEIDLALATVRDAVRVAALTASTRHLPTEVVCESGDADRPGSVRARVLAPVGAWHMEERLDWDDVAGLESTVTGVAEPGRFGLARRPELDGRTTLLHVPTQGRSLFDLSDGFALRIDVRLEQRTAMTVARLGTALEFLLDEELYPSVKLVGTEGGGLPGPAARVSGRRPLRLFQWQTLAVVHDGARLSLYVDDELVDRSEASLPILQTATDVFSVSPGEEPIVGLVDEVQLLAYELGTERLLPLGIEFRAEPPVFRFDRNGDLAQACAFALIDGDDERGFGVGPGGVIE